MRLGLLGSAGLAVMLTGCSMGHDELEKLCKKDAGTVIYKQVEAEGYYDNNCRGGCWLPLLDGNYKFIEIYNPIDKTNYNPGKGYWHVYLSNHNDENCYSIVTSRQKHRIREQQCIAFKEIAEPTATYEFNTDESYIYLDNYYKSKVTRQVQTIIEIKTKEVLGQTVLYYMDINPSSTGDGGPYQCQIINSKKMEFKNLAKSVFKK